MLKKDLPRLIADAERSTGEGLKRSLGAFNLTMLGIGATIGAGIFTLTGEAAASYAGPGIVYSFVLGGILCALAGLCYAEMAAMIPVAGSAYTYSYATMGEFAAWIIGWDLVLEYAFGAVAVANGWSSYLFSLVHRTLGLTLPDGILRLTKGPWEFVVLGDGRRLQGVWNVPATLIVLLLAAVLYRGVQESASFNNFVVAIKITIVVVFVLVGLGLISRGNLQANPAAHGLASLVPLRETVLEGGRQVSRFGWLRGGVITGAGVVFFAYIGFDAVSTTAQEARNPRRDMPIGILASLVICTVLYVLVALTLTGVVPFRELGVSDPIAVGVDRIVALRHWSAGIQKAFAFAVKLGALAGLTSVVLVIMMAQTRVFFSMARDGLLPWFDRVHPRHRTPQVATVVTGLLVAFGAGLMPISLVGKLVSIGTLLAFLLVCVGVPILRVTCPGLERPFRVPMPWVVGLSGGAACLWVMSSLDLGTWLRLVFWLLLGLAIYLTYGRRHSRLQQEKGMVYGPLATDCFGYALCLVALGGVAWSLAGLGAHAPMVGLVGLASEWPFLTLPLYGYLAATLFCGALSGYGLRLVLTNTVG
jgi:APA family basic amino acid/polyamine antiporter